MNSARKILWTCKCGSHENCTGTVSDGHFHFAGASIEHHTRERCWRVKTVDDGDLAPHVGQTSWMNPDMSAW